MHYSMYCKKFCFYLSSKGKLINLIFPESSKEIQATFSFFGDDDNFDLEFKVFIFFLKIYIIIVVTNISIMKRWYCDYVKFCTKIKFM